MNAHEAKRYAHRLVADLIDRAALPIMRDSHEEDALAIARAIDAITEQHRRFGPKARDRAPRSRTAVGEPLPFEAHTLGEDHAPSEQD